MKILKIFNNNINKRKNIIILLFEIQNKLLYTKINKIYN